MSPSPGPVADRYTADFGGADGTDLADWSGVTGPTWLSPLAWTLSGGLWRVPDVGSGQFGLRRYAGSAFGPDGRMPDLYALTVTVRPKSAGAGQIVVVPYFLDATHYVSVHLDIANRNVSIREYHGGSPTSGNGGTTDLSQSHRGWRPLPSAAADGSYAVRIKINAVWHSLALWVGPTWMDTPFVATINEQPHGIALRANGSGHEVLAIDVERYDRPEQAH